MTFKDISKSAKNSLWWGSATFTATFILFNINNLFNENKTIYSIVISALTLCASFIWNVVRRGKSTHKYNENFERQNFTLLFAIFCFLVTWYMFIGQSWETEKAEKIVSILSTWPSVALILLALFYTAIKTNLVKFLNNFSNGHFSLRVGDIELSPKELHEVLENTAIEATTGASGIESTAHQDETVEDLDQFPDSIKPIADRAKRKVLLDALPESFLIYLFGQIEKILRILYFVNISKPPPSRLGNRHTIRHITSVLHAENYIDDKFFDVFMNIIRVRNTIAHGEQLDESTQLEIRQICEYLSEYIIDEYLRNKDLYIKYWRVETF